MTTIELTQDEIDTLVEACIKARDWTCRRKNGECSTCNKNDFCDMLGELELKLQRK